MAARKKKAGAKAKPTYKSVGANVKGSRLGAANGQYGKKR